MVDIFISRRNLAGISFSDTNMGQEGLLATASCHNVGISIVLLKQSFFVIRFQQ